MNTQDTRHKISTSLDASDMRELSQKELYQAIGGSTSVRKIQQFEAIVERYGCTGRRGGVKWAIPMYDRLRTIGKWPIAKALRSRARQVCRVDIATAQKMRR